MQSILIVEDEEQVRVLAESILQGEGFETLSAATAEQAQALLESNHQVDLLFTDLTLESDTEAGIAVARSALRLRPELPVLYTTGQAVTDGMRAQFVDGSRFLPKPYTAADLVAAVQSLLLAAGPRTA